MGLAPVITLTVPASTSQTSRPGAWPVSRARVDGDVYHKRYCKSSRIAASIEVQVQDQTAELLHMYYAMELPYQHGLQTNLLARVQSLEMATIVVQHFQAIAEGPSFALKVSDELDRTSTERDWTALRGPASNPHRWVQDIVQGGGHVMRVDLRAAALARAQHDTHDLDADFDSWNFYIFTRAFYH